MELKIALAGNPNCGKTTLFNALTGSNQFVGNWPGVTVEKKEGKLKKHSDVTIMDLPGIYSLSPYTLEEVVARTYLVNERPDAILNIIDGTNLERNLYLTTQLTELGIPVVVAINMMDVVRKNGDKIHIPELSRQLGCKVVEISALKNDGIMEAAEAAVKAATETKTVPQHTFSGTVEHTLAHIEEVTVHHLPEEQQRFYAIKLFERDEKVMESMNLPKEVLDHIEKDIRAAEEEMDDDAESIITNERYLYIASIMKGCYKKKDAGKLTVSDKIDRVVTNRWAALPIFAAIMFVVYYVSVTTVGTIATDWANDGVFGDGWHLFGIGSGEYAEKAEEFGDATGTIEAFLALDAEGTDEVADALDVGAEDFDADVALALLKTYAAQFTDETVVYEYEDEDTFETVRETRTVADLNDAVAVYEQYACAEPDPADYGVWVPGIPVLIGNLLDMAGCHEGNWLNSLILDGIVAGVGAVLGFVPQMLVLFIFLAFLESCGYMARIAFVLDRIFRKFGLSGKSFIPMLVGTGCGVPGIMASRTIENDRDRKMTIMTTTFIPCGAKLPIIALVTAALFGGSKNGWWVAPSAYFLGIAAIVISGIILKKTRMFAGDPAPFVMELPAYHLPTVGNILCSMWERGWSFIKKAGTIILLSSIVIWAGSCFGVVDGKFLFDVEMEMESSILGIIGSAICWLFKPLGFGSIPATVATIMGLVAKEEVAGVFGVLDFAGTNMNALAGYCFLVFNLLCAPCFAAIGAIRREMNSAKWTWFAIGYQCVFAYVIALIVFQIGSIFTGNGNIVGVTVAILLAAGLIWLLIRPQSHSRKKEENVRQ